MIIEYSMNKNQGYTMIELLAVMAIIAMLIALGIQGLLMLRSTIEVQESSKQAITMFSLMKNNAKNDVRKSNELDFKGYRYRVDGDNHIDKCVIVDYATVNPWSCSYDSDVEAAFLTANYELNVGRGADDDPVQGVPECTAIYFEHLTGDIMVDLDTGGSVPTNGKCFIPVTDISKRFTNYLFINGIQDSFKVLTTPDQVVSEYSEVDEKFDVGGGGATTVPTLNPTSPKTTVTPTPTATLPPGVRRPN